jgi:hypothetical protein
MRLAGYVTLEIGLACGLILGAGYLGARGLARWGGASAVPARGGTGSAAALPAGGVAVTAAPLARRQELSTEATDWVAPGASAGLEAPGTFLGMSDDLLIARMRGQPVRSLKLNKGGSSLSFRVDFADGSRAAWKPAQTNTQTIPRKEVAAYRLNRLLGLGAVPPATARALARDDLFTLLHPDSLPALPRIRAETIVGPNGMVSGAASYWIPVIKDSKFDTPAGHQQVAAWLTQGEPMPFGERGMLAQLSTMALFDFLTANPDRHSGGNMKTSPDGTVLYFMDNTMSFFIEPEGTEKNRSIFLHVQRFSKRLVEALPRVTFPTLQSLMRAEDGAELLTDPEARTVVQRRALAEEYLHSLVRQFGEAEVLCFP